MNENNTKVKQLAELLKKRSESVVVKKLDGVVVAIKELVQEVTKRPQPLGS